MGVEVNRRMKLKCILKFTLRFKDFDDAHIRKYIIFEYLTTYTRFYAKHQTDILSLNLES